MEIVMQRGCICDCLEIDGISEAEMSDEQRKDYFKRIVDQLKTAKPIDTYGWFNSFLQWVCRTYGDYDCTDKPCECCGDYVETYKVILENQEK